jgi:DNA-binding response OmpR family regulator
MKKSKESWENNYKILQKNQEVSVAQYKNLYLVTKQQKDVWERNYNLIRISENNVKNNLRKAEDKINSLRSEIGKLNSASIAIHNQYNSVKNQYDLR